MEFKYASAEEQLKRANKFLVLGYIVYFLFIMSMMISFFLMGIRSKGMTLFLCSIILQEHSCGKEYFYSLPGCFRSML